MNIKSLLIASGIAGVSIAILSSIPIVSLVNCLACTWVWAGGIFGAWLYSYFERTSSMNIGYGAVVGIMSGFIAAIVQSLIQFVLGSGVGILGTLQSQSDVTAGILGSILVPGTFSIINLICINIFIYPFFGIIGGLIGGIIFSRTPSSAV
jgi:hypothetical protein